jgi:hypothetical protein
LTDIIEQITGMNLEPKKEDSPHHLNEVLIDINELFENGVICSNEYNSKTTIGKTTIRKATIRKTVIRRMARQKEKRFQSLYTDFLKISERMKLIDFTTFAAKATYDDVSSHLSNLEHLLSEQNNKEHCRKN